MSDITSFLKNSLNESIDANRTQKGIQTVVRNISAKFRNEHNETVRVQGNRISIDLKKYRDYGKSDGFILDRFESIMKKMFSDYSNFIETTVEKHQIVINITAISECDDNEDDDLEDVDEGTLKLGDWVSKRVKQGGGVTSGTEGYIVNFRGDDFQLADEWGGYNKNKWYEPKGFKIGKAKSKKVSTYKPVMDLIKELGGSINEASEIPTNELYTKALKELDKLALLLGVKGIKVETLWDGIHGIIAECRVGLDNFAQHPMVDMNDIKKISKLKTVRKIAFVDNDSITVYIKHETEVK